MKKGVIKNFEDFELHHKVIAFLVIIVITILITRGIIYYIIDPNPSIFGLELHHFDYGLALLTITTLLLLFGKRHFKTYLILAAISLGLIIDELFFIREQIGGNNPSLYNPSLKYVLLIAILVSLAALLILYISKRKK